MMPSRGIIKYEGCSVNVMGASPQVEISQVPVHVAIVMDGNGRWAEERKQPRLFGHKAGVRSVRTVVETAREIGVDDYVIKPFDPKVLLAKIRALLGT